MAVRTAELPQADPELGRYRVYLADRKVDLAMAQAQTRLLEDQRAMLEAQRERDRLDARTREADVAHAESAIDRSVAQQARGDAAAANVAAAVSAQQTVAMQDQIDKLNAKQTDRGLVLTLGDVLFGSGRSEMNAGAIAPLNKLVVFLNRYPDRTVSIEGYTDSLGGTAYNQNLSERRAGAVRAYLHGQGIDSVRLSATGMGDSDPIANNDTAAGRQQNRRVEIVVSNASVVSQ